MIFLYYVCVCLPLFNVSFAAAAAETNEDEIVEYWRCPENPKLNLALARAIAVRDRLTTLVSDECRLDPTVEMGDANKAYTAALAQIEILKNEIEKYRKDSEKK